MDQVGAARHRTGPVITRRDVRRALDLDPRSTHRFPLRRGCPGIRPVLCVQRGERLSYVLQSAPADPPVYLTWMIRPGPGGCTIRLQIDEIDAADSLQEAEDIWLPVLEALQQLVNPGSLPEAGTKARSGSDRV